MYAIVRIGGKQYHAEIGNTIVVEKLPYEVGQQLYFDEVLLLSDGEDTFIGQPFVEGASVSVEIVEQFKGKKIIVFKYKPKIRYRRKQGHRQNYTRLLVHGIGDVGSRPAENTGVMEEAVIETEISEPVAKKPRAAKKSVKAESGDEGSKPAKKPRAAKKTKTSEEA